MQSAYNKLSYKQLKQHCILVINLHQTSNNDLALSDLHGDKFYYLYEVAIILAKKGLGGITFWFTQKQKSLYGNPILYILDPVLIKHAIVIDFNYFMDQGMFYHNDRRNEF